MHFEHLFGIIILENNMSRRFSSANSILTAHPGGSLPRVTRYPSRVPDLFFFIWKKSTLNSVVSHAPFSALRSLLSCPYLFFSAREKSTLNSVASHAPVLGSLFSTLFSRFVFLRLGKIYAKFVGFPPPALRSRSTLKGLLSPVLPGCSWLFYKANSTSLHT